MSTEKTIVIPQGVFQNETVKGGTDKGWKIVRNTAGCIMLVFAINNSNAQCVVPAINAEFPNEQAYIGQDSVQVTVTEPTEITLASGGSKFHLYINGILDTDGSGFADVGDLVKIKPHTPGVESINVQGDCNNVNWSEANEAMQQILPIKRSEINAYVKNGELKVDAKSEQAVNVDHIDLEVSVNGSDFVVEDKEQAVNGNAPKTYNFSVSVDELIRKHNIVKPTVFYTRLTNHDFDGQTQTSDVQAVEISPDGTVTPLKVFPNIAQNADQISFAIGGDTETLYPVRIIELTTGRVINETFISGATVNKLSDIIGDSQINAGNYVVQSMLNGGVQTTRFVIAK